MIKWAGTIIKYIGAISVFRKYTYYEGMFIQHFSLSPDKLASKLAFPSSKIIFVNVLF